LHALCTFESLPALHWFTCHLFTDWKEVLDFSSLHWWLCAAYFGIWPFIALEYLISLNSLVVLVHFVLLEENTTNWIMYKEENFIFSQFWRLISPRSKCWHVWCLVRATLHFQDGTLLLYPPEGRITSSSHIRKWKAKNRVLHEASGLSQLFPFLNQTRKGEEDWLILNAHKSMPHCRHLIHTATHWT
jgi:hypothetical protein